MGNQVRSMEARMGWFAGIMDGEGSFAITSNPASKRQLNGFGQLKAKMTMWNSDMVLVNEFMQILDEHRLPYHVFTQKPRANNLNVKIQYRVEIHGLKRLQRVLPKVIPYLISKKAKAEAMLAFCNSRLSTARNSRYTQHEIDLANQVRVVPLHACAETKRQTQNVKV